MKERSGGRPPGGIDDRTAPLGNTLTSLPFERSAVVPFSWPLRDYIDPTGPSGGVHYGNPQVLAVRVVVRSERQSPET